jgi:transcriptional regulator with XRE-family HTH domain
MGAMKKSIHTAEYRRLRSFLRETREKAGLSQRQLAARLKVPHSWVAKVENGERRMDVVELCWLISACDGDPVALCQKLLREIDDSRRGTGEPGGRRK